jgi:hypothetical protein
VVDGSWAADGWRLLKTHPHELMLFHVRQKALKHFPLFDRAAGQYGNCGTLEVTVLRTRTFANTVQLSS